jgi:CubicO group peptidase (beta-lactamase class C family)
MNRRTFIACGLGTLVAPRRMAALNQETWDAACDVLAAATADGRVHAAALHVRRRGRVFARSFGAAQSPDDPFLLASITKPMTAAALMTLHDQGHFSLDDPARRFLPEFTGDGRETITMRQLLTHVCGLPDQLPENAALRRRQAALPEFVERALRTPLLFAPGSRYSYSSMGILLASEAASRISGIPFKRFIDEALFQKLDMRHSALGLGRFKLGQTVRCQVEHAAPESGAGDPSTKDWDWNSPYWRDLGAPWGGAHGSAADVATFLGEFLHPAGRVLRPDTARLLTRNHNPGSLKPRGLGFDIGRDAGGAGCSDRTFGHGGSTGTLAWADPATDTVCVVLTTLPGGAASPHPREQASDLVAKGAK